MNSNPKISVITVCYNSQTHIADTLKSVDIQTLQDREHIIVDGASKDNTIDIVAQHSHPTRRVVSEPDKGIYDAMNKGLGLARGDIVGYINSDDFYPTPTVLECVAESFDDPSVDAVYGDLCYVKQHDATAIVRYWRSSPFTPGLFSRAWCPPHPTLFVRRSVYERLGGYDLRFPIAADMELMARYMEVHSIKTLHLSKVLVHMRMGGTTNRSLRNILQQNREIWRALAAHHLQPSPLKFIAGKISSRGRQFFTRPA